MKKYKIIYADPPWSYNDKGCNGNCENHYRTISLNSLCELNIKAICDDDCVLFMWTTYPMIKEGLQLIEAWGFKYKSIAFQWIKLNKKNGKPFYGLGRWTRGNTEPCLLATKGKPKRISASVFQLIQTPIQGHSQKPNIVRDKIVELVGDLPRIELFARKPKDRLFQDKSWNGWDIWGNENEHNNIELLPKGKEDKNENIQK